MRLLLLLFLLLLISPQGYSQDKCNLTSILTEKFFNSVLLHKDDAACPANGFYTYSSLIKAASSYAEFGSTGNITTCKHEIAAFLAVISDYTKGGSATTPDDTSGLCFKEEISSSDYCNNTYTQSPCYPGKSYHPRGPFKLSGNYDYWRAGKTLNFSGLENPDLVTKDSVIAFKTALLFWFDDHKSPPNYHHMMVGGYQPTAADLAANQPTGFGLVTKLVTGGRGCGIPAQSNVLLAFYKRYCQKLGVDPGPNLHC